MEKIKIIVDCASDVTASDATELDISLVSASVTYEGKTTPEADIIKTEYLNILLDCKDVPTTAQVTPTQVFDAYKSAYENGYTHVIVVTISSTGSGFYNNSFIAKGLFEDEFGKGKMQFAIMDSLAYTYSYGKPVLDAAAMAKDGVSFDDIVTFLKEELACYETTAGFYTLKFAKKSGRISGVAAMVGEMMGVRPIILMMNGSVDIAEKARGDGNVIPTIIRRVKERAVDIENQDIIIIKGIISDEQEADLISCVEKELKPKSYKVCLIGPSIATNTGPRMCGIVYKGAKRDREWVIN